MMMRTVWLLLLSFGAASAQPDDAAQLRQQAAKLIAQGNYAQAEPLLALSLAEQEKFAGPDDPSLTVPLDALAALYRAEGRNPDAQKMYKRSLAIHQKAAGPASLDLIPDLKSLAILYA